MLVFEGAFNVRLAHGDGDSEMMDDALYLAKITAPTLADIVNRPRLYGLLDNALARPLVWVSGPGGCGKTTLIASYVQRQKRRCLWYQVDGGDTDPAAVFHYLRFASRKASPRSRRPLPQGFAPEFMVGIATFARRFFRSLFSRLIPPCFLVFDNLQEVPSETAFYHLLRESLDEVPPGANVILVSRSEPPAIFSRFRAARSLAQIGWKDLRFTKAEARRLLSLLGNEGISDAVLTELMDATQGWAAGLILMSLAAEPGREYGLPVLLGEAIDEDVFDYFATELFRHTKGPEKDVLLKTAFLPTITTGTAEYLSGNPRAADILNSLVRRNMFVIRRPQGNRYEFHPLARRFFQEQAARIYEAHELAELKRLAAASLANDGQLNEAVALLREIEAWKALVPLIEGHAPKLLSETRHQTLESWLAVVPPPVLRAYPWLRYWLGVSRALTKPDEAYAVLALAYEQFNQDQDAAGAFLAWSSVVELLGHSQQYNVRLDHWLEEFENLLASYPEYPSAAIECRVAASMVTALAYQRSWDRSIHRWSERAAILAERAGNTDLQCHALLGRLHATLLETYDVERTVVGDRVRLLLDHCKASEFVRLEGRLWATSDHCYAGRHRECLKAAAEALAFAECTGILLYNPLLLYWMGLSSLTAGDLASGCATIEKMTSQLQPGADSGRVYQSFLHAYERYLKGDLHGAEGAVARALVYLGEDGMTSAHTVVRFLAAHILSELGKPEQAKRHLAGVKTYAERSDNPLVMHNCLLCEAEIALNQDDLDTAVPHLRNAMALGRDMPVNYALVWHPSALARLCVLALERDIEVDTVQRIIRERALLPDERGRYLDAWPWPLKIRTLGQFTIIRDQEPIEFSRKAPRRPLDCLKALVAYGGRGVSAERLKDVLWPDAEGDAAQHAFDMTLHRLRSLLGIEGALVLNDGRLTLSSDLCWVDVWALKELVVAATATLKRSNSAPFPEQVERYEEKALALYSGPFLDDGPDQSWAISARNAIATTVLRFLRDCGLFWERRGALERAAACYERAQAIASGVEVPNTRVATDLRTRP